VIASALLLRGSAEGVSFFRIFGYEAYPQQEPTQNHTSKEMLERENKSNKNQSE
jgi:hypothetical protein